MRYFLYALVLLPIVAMGQTSPSDDQNYVRQSSYQVALTEAQVDAIDNANAPIDNDKRIEGIVYYDGLGRPRQNVAIRAGGSKEDLVTPIEYDGLGRQPKDYLPYPVLGNIGSYIENPYNSLTTYYLNNFPDDSHLGTAINPYSEKRFENSPLNRVLEQGAPGMDWKVDLDGDTDHTIKFGYLSNTSEDEIKLFKVFFEGGDTEVPGLEVLGFYPPNSLYKNKIKDENWTGGNNNTTEEFTNKLGQVVLKRTFNEGVNHDTYYVYDVFGNLTYVHSPKGSPLITGTTANIISSDIVESGDNLELYATQTITLVDGFHAKSGSDFLAQIVPDQQGIIDELSYSYRYDMRNRLFAKKIPGKGWEFIIYNQLNQPVLSQDANLRLTNEWLFTKYDAFGRVTYTGIMNDPYTNEPDEWERRKLLQADINAQTQLFETAGNSTIDGINTKWTNSAYPQANINTILSINYYDNYNWDIAGIANPGTVFGASITNNTKTLATGGKVRVLGTNHWITNVSYYDVKARPIYGGSKNEFLSTMDIFKSKLDFVGKVMEDENLHTKGGTTIKTNNLYTYDHMGRLKTQSRALNNGTRQLIVNNTYDGLGQLISNKTGGPVATIPESSVGLQTVDYNYNIRGWLKEINDVANLGTDLFAFNIGYNQGSNSLYNGNISSTQWKTNSLNPTSNPVSNSYNYTYDALNRIKTAIDNTGHYGLTLVDYDRNGNILHLDRQGHTDQNATQFGEMDKLAYSYGSGNKLHGVADSGNKSHGFRDGSNSGDDYEYDANGNMKLDANKGITGVLYNHLNLPVEIKFDNSNTKKIIYNYSADGTKLRKHTNANGSVTTTDYAGGFVYQDNVLQFINQPEGYIEPDNGGGFKYVFQYKDHLGNIRLSYSDTNGNGTVSQSEIIEENNYYPFGLQHKGYNNVVTSTNPAQNYTFNSKEEQKELGLNWLDFGARNYDPAIARWTTIDPVTHFNQSTYTAFDNNPVYFADPSGTTTVSSITEAWYATPDNGSSSWNSDGNGGFCDDCPQEGQSRTQKKSHINPLDGMESYTYENQRYSSQGNGQWLSEETYFESFRPLIRQIAQGQASIEVLGSYNFTDDVLLSMVGWASQAYDYYGGQVPKASGAITPMGFDSPFFLPGAGLKFLNLSRTSKFAFYSGKGTQNAAINAGYKVIGQTRAGQNLAALTSNMVYETGSQAYKFWGRLSQALARTVPKGGSANVFLTRDAVNNASSIWNRFEKPILIQNNVKIKYNWID